MKRIEGVVRKGKRRGSALGYPTINIALDDQGLSGVYAGRVVIKDEAPYMAALFADQTRNILEAYILDFSDDLYGLDVRIEVYEKIRDAGRYEDDDALKRAIADDIAKVREYFKN